MKGLKTTMLQMLGLRGQTVPSSPFSSSISVSQNSNPNPDSSPNASARPVRLVYCDDKGKFHIDPDDVEALQLVKGPISVVTVCGHARQGKSFILNQFFEIERLSSDFAICTYTGRWEKIRSNSRWMKKSRSLLIEDPFERPDNAARAVGSQDLFMISEAFKKTSRKLSKSSVLSSRNALLANLVRPNIRSVLEEMVGFIGI